MTISSEGSDPRLPRELERAIFELAALRRPRSIPVLMLVAWRVKEWLDPILFRTLGIGPDSTPFKFPNTAVLRCTFTEFEMLARSHAAVGRSLRNARLWRLNEEQQHALLALTPNVENLYIYPSIQQRVSAAQAPLALVNLLRLSTGIFYLGYQFKTLAPTHTCLSHLTHLSVFLDQLFATTPTNEIWRKIAALPALTHVANSTSSAANASVIISILASAERLRLIVFHALSPYEERVDSGPLRRGVQVVLLVSTRRLPDELESEFRGAESMWERAERFLQGWAAMQDPDSIMFLDERNMKLVGDTL
ncbi:hypothetical protein MKEN_00850300 [Mycena kentingensis (nom. inval.)]|nr:hypothetical protein MKEN_00850300 [Mycena kentingensis (nom. inval.)]